MGVAQKAISEFTILNPNFSTRKDSTFTKYWHTHNLDYSFDNLLKFTNALESDFKSVTNQSSPSSGSGGSFSSGGGGGSGGGRSGGF